MTTTSSFCKHPSEKQAATPARSPRSPIRQNGEDNHLKDSTRVATVHERAAPGGAPQDVREGDTAPGIQDGRGGHWEQDRAPRPPAAPLTPTRGSPHAPPGRPPTAGPCRTPARAALLLALGLRAPLTQLLPPPRAAGAPGRTAGQPGSLRALRPPVWTVRMPLGGGARASPSWPEEPQHRPSTDGAEGLLQLPGAAQPQAGPAPPHSNGPCSTAGTCGRGGSSAGSRGHTPRGPGSGGRRGRFPREPRQN